MGDRKDKMILSVLINLIAFSKCEECSLESAEIYCGMETMSIRVPICAMEEYGSVVLERAKIGPKNETCEVEPVNMGDSTLFEVRLNDCATQMAMNSTHVVY